MTETTTIFTFAQFAMIGVFALLVIIGILFGMRMKRRRRDAEAEVEAHREAVGETAEAPSAPPPAVEATRPVPVEPVTPTIDSPVKAAPVEPVSVGTAPATLAENEVSPAPAPPPAAAPLAGDITQLKGLGPKLATTLAGLGITRFDQIAAMSPSELADLDAQLGAFKGRPARDRWAEQAALLVAGDKAAYEAEFGKLG